MFGWRWRRHRPDSHPYAVEEKRTTGKEMLLARQSDPGHAGWGDGVGSAVVKAFGAPPVSQVRIPRPSCNLMP